MLRPGEEPQLDDTAQALVERRQVGQRFVEREDVDEAFSVPAAASSMPRIVIPPPRLSAFFRRAWSTRISRINRAAIAKKCVRFCSVMRSRSTSRKYASCTSAVVWSVWSDPSSRRRAPRHAAQFLVDEGDQPRQRGLVAAPPFDEKIGDVLQAGWSVIGVAKEVHRLGLESRRPAPAMTSPRPEDWRQVREVFEGALALPAAERPAFVAESCGTNQDLGRQVAALLDSHDRASDFLETPARELLGNLAVIDLEGARIGPYELESRDRRRRHGRGVSGA